VFVCCLLNATSLLAAGGVKSANISMVAVVVLESRNQKQ
jgi:hypothetical protein